MGKSFNPIGQHRYTETKRKKRTLASAFHDRRLEQRWRLYTQRVIEKQSVVIEQLAHNRSESAAFYRFLRNKKVTVPELVHLYTEVAPEHVRGRSILVLGDSTSYNMKGHVGRITDAARLGVLDDNRTPGYFAHVHMAVDALNGYVVGLADVLLWMRPRAEGAKQRATQAEERESYKWRLGAEQAAGRLGAAAQLTFVLDQDADKFEVFRAIAKPPRTHVLIRLRYDRTVQATVKLRQKLSAYLAQFPVLGTYTIALPALNHYATTKGRWVRRPARQATLQVRAAPVTLAPPLMKPATAPLDVPLWCVEVQEVGLAPTCTEEAVHWRLLTTHGVECFEQAQQIVTDYTRRWMIEQLFRTTKSECFNLEATELETVDAILAQTVSTCYVATKVLQLVYARDQPSSQPLAEVFIPSEQTVLQHLNTQYQGTTPAAQNPYPPDQTSYATWIIARLAGWKGNRTQHPPGPTTLCRGLEKFYVFVKAFEYFNSA